MPAMPPPIADERAGLMEYVAAQQYAFHAIAFGLTDEQARSTPSVSALSIGGLIKHVSSTERGWYEFATDAPGAMAGGENTEADYADGFTLREDETLADVIAEYDAVAARTDELAATADLDVAYPLPPAPWFAPGATRSVRRVLVHLVGETAQHAGHADIIREAIDGQKTMG